MKSLVRFCIRNPFITLALTAWYAENSIFAMTIVIGLAAYALHVALGKRPVRPAGVA